MKYLRAVENNTYKVKEDYLFNITLEKLTKDCREINVVQCGFMLRAK
jgi:hypothetical protein